jgi:hypothetical protein
MNLEEREEFKSRLTRTLCCDSVAMTMQISKKVRGRVKLLLSAVVLDAAVGSLTL